MTVSRNGEPSPEQIARENRRRLAREDGARALNDVAETAVAVRKNMAKLRALRLARDAQERLDLPPGARKIRKAAKARIAVRPEKVGPNRSE